MDKNKLFSVVSVLEDLAVKSFDMNEIDEMIDKNWLGSVTNAYFPDGSEEDWMTSRLERTRKEDFDIKNNERIAWYKDRRDYIFSCKTHKELDEFLDNTDDFVLEPDLDFSYNGLLWAVEKRSAQIDQEQKLRAKIEQDRKFSAMLERARLIEAGKIKPALVEGSLEWDLAREAHMDKIFEATMPQKEVVQVKKEIPVVESVPPMPIIMRLHGTSTLKRVEEAHVYRALIKQGYEIYNVKA